MDDISDIGFLIIIIAVIAIMGLAILSPFYEFSSIGEGTHSGFVTAIDQRGYIFKNYDVYFKTDNSSSQEDVYCVHRNDQGLVSQLRQKSESGEKITIQYKGVQDIGLGICKNTQVVGFIE